MNPKQPTSFRLDPRHLRVLASLQERLEREDGVHYSQARLVEMAIGCLWEKKTGQTIYAAFVKRDE